jgi:cbb3-type cytochrome oxidase cytochrome c subunit
MTDRAFAQDTSYALCTTASKLQRVAKQWNDAAHRGHLFDPQHVAIEARDAAKRFHELADEIEERCHTGVECVASEGALK